MSPGPGTCTGHRLALPGSLSKAERVYERKGPLIKSKEEQENGIQLRNGLRSQRPGTRLCQVPGALLALKGGSFSHQAEWEKQRAITESKIFSLPGAAFFFFKRKTFSNRKPCPRAFRWHRKVETPGKSWRWDWDEVMGQVAETLQPQEKVLCSVGSPPPTVSKRKRWGGLDPAPETSQFHYSKRRKNKQASLLLPPPRRGKKAGRELAGLPAPGLCSDGEK